MPRELALPEIQMRPAGSQPILDTVETVGAVGAEQFRMSEPRWLRQFNADRSLRSSHHRIGFWCEIPNGLVGPTSERNEMKKLTGALLLTVLLTGCGGTMNMREKGQAEGAVTSAPTLPPETTAETTTPTPTTPAGPSRNNRGNIVKAFGEEGGLTEQIGGQEVAIVTFAIDSIAPVTCTEPYYSYEPENGHLIAVQMRFSTAPELAQSQYPYFSVSPYEFSFIGADNITRGELATIATYGCLPDGQLLTSGEMIPGSQYAGIVILDVPEPNGTLIFRPSSLTSGGWEWVF